MVTRRERLSAVLNHDEPLVMVIRGHLWLESVLETALSEALERPDVMDLARVSFERRIELAVALGVIGRELQAGYVKANWLRNQYVHDPEFELGSGEARDLYNTISGVTRGMLEPASDYESARAMTAECFAVLIALLEAAVRHLRDDKVRQRELAAEVRQVLREREEPYDPASDPVERRIEAVVERERTMRRSQGDL